MCILLHRIERLFGGARGGFVRAPGRFGSLERLVRDRTVLAVQDLEPLIFPTGSRERDAGLLGLCSGGGVVVSEINQFLQTKDSAEALHLSAMRPVA